MKKKLSVRDYREYYNSRVALEMRAWNQEWREKYREDSDRARAAYGKAIRQDAIEAWAEALSRNKGEVGFAELELISKLIIPPHYDHIAVCSNCGPVPAKASESDKSLPNCVWCGFITSQQESEQVSPAYQSESDTSASSLRELPD